MIIAFDTETDLIGPFRQAPPLACVSYAWRDSAIQAGLMHHADSRMPDLSRMLLGSRLVGHGVSFDLAVILNHDPSLWPLVIAALEADRVSCTIVRQKLIDIANGVYRGFDHDEDGAHKITYDLDAMAWRHCRIKLDKNTWRLRYGELRKHPLTEWPEGAIRYPIADAQALIPIWEAQEVFREEYLADQYRQTRASFWIRLMTNWGLRTNRQGVERLAHETQQSIAQVTDTLYEAGLLKPPRKVRHRDGTESWTKPKREQKKARELIVNAYRSRGLMWPLTDNETNPLPSLNKVACEESGDPLLHAYSEFTTLGNILSADVPLLSRGVEEPIHVYCETMLATGRTSTSPNVQNVKKGFSLPKAGEYNAPRTHYRKVRGQGEWLIVPQGIRECFTPSQPGWVFVSADYSGLELCTLAQACIDLFGFSTLAEALNNGIDPHSVIGSQIPGVPYAEFLQWYKADNHPQHDFAFMCRQTGKVVNFGRPGGLGAQTLVFYAKNNYGVDLSENHFGIPAVDYARKLIGIYNDTWHEMPRYYDYINTTIQRGSLPRIQQVRSWRVRGRVSYTEACNTIFQGLGADVAKSAGWYIAKEMYAVPSSPLFGFRMCNFIHDEFLLEGPEARAHDAAMRLSELMVFTAKQWLPDVKIKAEPMVSRLWSKKAKPVHKEGRLVPWEPIPSAS